MNRNRSWSVAVFAHNVAGSVAACLDSVLRQHSSAEMRVAVLVNGCTDKTGQRVSDYARRHPGVTLVEIDRADKANAWNHYVHQVREEADVHFFVDGDTTVGDGAFAALDHILAVSPVANAAGAMPVCGRNRSQWVHNMARYGRLAGGLYALCGGFLSELRHRSVRLPVGLIGDDLFVSCLAKETLTRRGFLQPSPRLVVSPAAGFAFETLRWTRPGDWLKYARRLVRYRIRDYQVTMLLRRLEETPGADLPSDVATIYRNATDLPDYYWRGWLTPVDILAVRHIRRIARERPIREQ